MLMCPKCNSIKVVKNGFHHEKQRHKCKECAFQFTRDTPRGRSTQEKATAIMLYSMGLSVSSIAHIFKVTPPAVLRWVEKFAEKTHEKPMAKESAVVDFDEMWTYLHSEKASIKSGKLILAIPVSSLPESVGIVLKSYSKS